MAKRYKTLIAYAAIAAAGLVTPAPWKLAAVRATPQAGATVRTAPAGQRLGGNPGQKGATYFALEAQTTRLTTRFGDAVVVAERTLDGDVETMVRDESGREAAHFKVDRIDGVNDVLQFAPADGAPLQAFSDRSVTPTLDWANRQAYSLWKDRVAGDSGPLEWQDGLIRPRNAAKRDVGAGIVELRTEWANGLVSTTTRRTVQRHEALAGRFVDGDVLVARLTGNGTELGTANWYPGAQLLMWNLPGLTKGYLDAGHLKDFGGWPFEPDAAWLNLQTIAFHHYKSLIRKQGFVAKQERSWPARVVQFFAPTLSANEPGCDDLHWLDGTILRYCCDVHDLCYEKYGCSAKSWWQFWSNWTCEYCNAFVVFCFLDGGVDWSDRGMVK